MPSVKDYLSDFERLGISPDEEYHELQLKPAYADLLKHLELQENGSAMDPRDKNLYNIANGCICVGGLYIPGIIPVDKAGKRWL